MEWPWRGAGSRSVVPGRPSPRFGPRRGLGPRRGDCGTGTLEHGRCGTPDSRRAQDGSLAGPCRGGQCSVPRQVSEEVTRLAGLRVRRAGQLLRPPRPPPCRDEHRDDHRQAGRTKDPVEEQRFPARAERVGPQRDQLSRPADAGEIEPCPADEEQSRQPAGQRLPRFAVSAPVDARRRAAAAATSTARSFPWPGSGLGTRSWTWGAAAGTSRAS